MRKMLELLFRQKLRKEVRSDILELEFAFSGKEALELLRSQKPPEVMYFLSDINMPGMTGLELLNQILHKIDLDPSKKREPRP